MVVVTVTLISAITLFFLRRRVWHPFCISATIYRYAGKTPPLSASNFADVSKLPSGSDIVMFVFQQHVYLMGHYDTTLCPCRQVYESNLFKKRTLAVRSSISM